MNLYQEYQAKLRTPEEAVQVVKSGDWITPPSSATRPCWTRPLQSAGTS